MSNPPDLRPDLAARKRSGRAPRGPADHRHGLARLSEGAGRQRAYSDPASRRRGMRSARTMAGRPGGDREHLRISGQCQGGKPGRHRRGPCPGKRARHRYRLPGGRARAYHRRASRSVLAVTGPHQYEQVLDAVHKARCRLPPIPSSICCRPKGVKLTPRHYSYLKISEGCNHACKFCIIPDMRGKLASRPGPGHSARGGKAG